MKIIRTTPYVVGIPFQERIDHQLKSRKQTASLVVEVVTETGYRGYGEATPREYVTGERMAGVFEDLLNLSPALCGFAVNTATEISTYAAELAVQYGPSLACAVEIALLDALGKQQGRSISQYLPALRCTSPTYSGVLPFVSPEKLAGWLARLQALQLPTLKVKVGREDDVERLRQIRQVLGPAVAIRLDANRAWSAAEAAARIEALLPFNPTWIEEPLQAESIAELPTLANASPLPILLDESVTTLAEAEYYANRIRHGQFAINLKLSKMGGLFGAGAIHRFAETNGIPCQLGCHVGETAILTAAGRHFAQRHRLRYVEGAYAPFFMADDLSVFPVSFAPGGQMKTLTGAGLGITIVKEKLTQYSVEQLSPIA